MSELKQFTLSKVFNEKTMYLSFDGWGRIFWTECKSIIGSESINSLTSYFRDIDNLNIVEIEKDE